MNWIFRHHWSLSAALSAFIFLALVWKLPEPAQETVAWIDKWIHFGVFLALACAYINTATDGFRIVHGGRYLRAFVAAAAYGLVLETIQYFLPWRSTELSDALADMAGAASGTAACWLLYRRLGR